MYSYTGSYIISACLSGLFRITGTVMANRVDQMLRRSVAMALITGKGAHFRSYYIATQHTSDS